MEVSEIVAIVALDVSWGRCPIQQEEVKSSAGAWDAKLPMTRKAKRTASQRTFFFLGLSPLRSDQKASCS